MIKYRNISLLCILIVITALGDCSTYIQIFKFVYIQCSDVLVHFQGAILKICESLHTMEIHDSMV